jgi:hypothetical protein
MAALVVVVALLLVSVSAPAIPAAEVDPDRPEVTESAKLVPRGAVQLESGVALSRERRAGVVAERTFQIEADLRIGVAHDLELNLGWEPLVRVRGPEDDTGTGDVTVGVRYRFRLRRSHGSDRVVAVAPGTARIAVDASTACQIRARDAKQPIVERYSSSRNQCLTHPAEGLLRGRRFCAMPGHKEG